MHTPLFWSDKDSLLSKLLTPYAWAYGLGHKTRMAGAKPESVSIPVICVGNLVAGGAGKTPVALALAERFKAAGKKPFLLTRGHGGALAGPLLIDPSHHSAAVGDEALLLAACAQTIMAKDRVAGARMAVKSGADIIIMDDGFQNPSLKKDVSILVVDGYYGFGNERLIPAGPLREPLESGFARADAFIVVGEDRHNLMPVLAAKHPVLRAHMEIQAENIRGQRVVAFAGIGRPEKFFRSLRDYGCEVTNTNGFPDHYRFKKSDIARLKQQAAERQAQLVTTEKDFVRLPESWREGINPISAHLVFEDEATLHLLFAPYL